MQRKPEKGNAPEVAATEASNVQNQLFTEGSNMSDHTEVTASRAITVPFHGADLYVVEHDSQPYTPMKPIITGMGLTWHGQHAKIKTNARRWGVLELRIPSSGGLQDMLCMPLRKLPGWLSGIEAGKVKSEEARAKVVEYQDECDDVLWQYWNEGIVINPRVAYSVQPGQTLSAEQAETLRTLLTNSVKRLPKGKQAGAMVKGWSKLKAHFKTDYRHIPAQEFSEAVSIIARHTAEWEVLEREPAAAQPAPLPRLHLHQVPPPIGSYRYSPANPYPANGRTIEMAKSITADIRNWSDSLPAGPARNDLHDAAQMLYDLLVSGWTEVDEALGQIHAAMHYLNRWQGRGGRMGNVR